MPRSGTRSTANTTTSRKPSATCCPGIRRTRSSISSGCSVICPISSARPTSGRRSSRTASGWRPGSPSGAPRAARRPFSYRSCKCRRVSWSTSWRPPTAGARVHRLSAYETRGLLGWAVRSLVGFAREQHDPYAGVAPAGPLDELVRIVSRPHALAREGARRPAEAVPARARPLGRLARAAAAGVLGAGPERPDRGGGRAPGRAGVRPCLPAAARLPERAVGKAVADPAGAGPGHGRRPADGVRRPGPDLPVPARADPRPVRAAARGRAGAQPGGARAQPDRAVAGPHRPAEGGHPGPVARALLDHPAGPAGRPDGPRPGGLQVGRRLPGDAAGGARRRHPDGHDDHAAGWARASATTAASSTPAAPATPTWPRPVSRWWRPRRRW